MCSTLGTERSAALDRTLGSSVGSRGTRPRSLAAVLCQSCQVVAMEEAVCLVEGRGINVVCLDALFRSQRLAWEVCGGSWEARRLDGLITNITNCDLVRAF